MGRTTKTERRGKERKDASARWVASLDKCTSDAAAPPCSPRGLDSFSLASASKFEVQSFRPSLCRSPSSRADILQSLQQSFRRCPNDGCTQGSPDLPGYFSEEPL